MSIGTILLIILIIALLGALAASVGALLRHRRLRWRRAGPRLIIVLILVVLGGFERPDV
jgi:hypothetical protein